MRTSLNSKYPRLALSFELSQSQTTHYGYSTHSAREEIASFLETNIKGYERKGKAPHYIVRTYSLKTNINILRYLNKFPLKGTKFRDFKDWSKVLSYFQVGNHRSNIQKIIEIKSQINDRRTTYNWDHLR